MSQLSLQWLILPATVALVAAALFAPLGSEVDAGSEDFASAEIDPELLAVSAELEVALQYVGQRVAVKERLIAQLVEGQQTLEGVTVEFLRLNRESDPCMRVIRENFPGATDEEKAARNVIAYALSRARTPEQKQALEMRLEREFEQTYGAKTAP